MFQYRNFVLPLITKYYFIFQRNEVSSANAMELEGLKRGLGELKKRRVPWGSIVTDRHIGIKSFLRDTYKNVAHWFDIWHMAKSKH